MARVIIVKEFTEETKKKLLEKVEAFNFQSETPEIFYVTDNAMHCSITYNKGKAKMHTILPTMWHSAVYLAHIELAEVWEQ